MPAKTKTASIALALALLSLAAPAFAQGAPDKGASDKAAKADAAIPPPTVSVTRHKGNFGGQSISYTATAGETYLKAEDGTPRAAIFSTAYVKDGKDPNRPVTFLFNGGPGSGSVWLHMGAFGPKRVAIPSDGTDDGGAALPDRRQSRFAARRHRHRLHRSGRHRLQPRARQDRAQGILGRHQGRRIGRAVHPAVAQREWPLERAQISRRRELRHDPLGGGRQPARGRL